MEVGLRLICDFEGVVVFVIVDVELFLLLDFYFFVVGLFGVFGVVDWCFKGIWYVFLGIVVFEVVGVLVLVCFKCWWWEGVGMIGIGLVLNVDINCRICFSCLFIFFVLLLVYGLNFRNVFFRVFNEFFCRVIFWNWIVY